ncbi:hypothetical protein BUALT_Bualt08G0146200 [Buddleja alternifolia]|uniref:Uncharacterized protein n=1 Tax=Buddleja alternifolia TaxID=168488 RepID=A0AAV6XDG1_9LAMI|nr:hypothetical protein BUALT_Bualt08G0146200 [Buddleja alternifolia]
MASRQATKEENAEAAARVAIDNLSDTRRHEEEQKTGSGILGSIMNRYEQVKEAVTTNKPHDDVDHDVTIEQDSSADETLAESGNISMVEIGQYTNYAAQKEEEPIKEIPPMDKAGEYNDNIAEKAKETKDNALQKAGEYEEYAMDKVQEETDVFSGRMAEVKELATAAARRAMDYFTGKAGDLDQKALDGGDINDEKYGETEFKAREKMQELKLNEEGVYDEAKQRAWADKETAADRGVAAKRNIYGAMGTVKDAIREKLTYPTGIVQEARASREYGGPKRGRGHKLVDEVEGGPSGPAAMPSARASG